MDAASKQAGLRFECQLTSKIMNAYNNLLCVEVKPKELFCYILKDKSFLWSIVATQCMLLTQFFNTFNNF